MTAAATVIRGLHLLLVAFVVCAPFTSSRPLLVLHALTIPFLWLHWVLNDDTCALTVLESRLRGVRGESTFAHALVAPVYALPDGATRVACWLATAGLWALTLRKVGWRDVTAELWTACLGC